ncbi:hypothetical protein NL676_014563 [Syzygium grande]|nr:hypothetical protein NL676_014563 [Syzygium grande]
MARKGNQQKNGVSRSSQNGKKKGSETHQERRQATDVKIPPKETTVNSHHSSNASAESMSQGTGKLMSMDKQGTDAAQGLEHPVLSRESSGDYIQNASPMGMSHEREQGGLDCDNNCQNSRKAIAMVGMVKFLVVSVLAVLVGFFLGFAAALLLLALCGTVFLWFYGSFWTTALVIILAGISFILSHERLALFISTIYAVYSAWAYVGWMSLLFDLEFALLSVSLTPTSEVRLLAPALTPPHSDDFCSSHEAWSSRSGQGPYPQVALRSLETKLPR